MPGRIVTIWIVLGAAALLGTLLYWNLAGKMGHVDRFRDRVRSLLAEIGAEPLDEMTCTFEGRRYQISTLPPTLFSGNLYITVGLYTPRVFDFSMRQAEGVSARAWSELADDPLYGRFDFQGMTTPALGSFLNKPRTRQIIEGALLGRWRALRQNFLQLTFEDNLFMDRDLDAPGLRVTLRALRALDEAAPKASFDGGTMTFRSGFEEGIPPWHWPLEELRSLPPEITRCAVSYHRGDPYLNPPLARLWVELGGEDSRALFLSEGADAGYIEHAFGSCARQEGSTLESRSADAMAAADHFTDGHFFQGFVALDPGADASWLAGMRRVDMHPGICARLPDVRVYVRRLLDEEASWYSGEFEILSTKLTESEVRAAVERAAEACGAKFLPIDRRFSVKMFRDEAFEYST